MAITVMLLTSCLSGISYRLGGASKNEFPYLPQWLVKGYIRVIGVPIAFLLYFIFRSTYHWTLLPSAILLGIAVNAYHKWLNPLFKKPKTDAYWFNWYIHGFGITLSLLPYIIFTGEWINFFKILLFLPISILLWSEIFSNVFKEEFGRGFLIIFTLWLFNGKGVSYVDDILKVIQAHWVEIGVVIIAFHTFIKALRDAIDKTPETDDNWFERMVTVLDKTIKYLFAGKRPNA